MDHCCSLAASKCEEYKGLSWDETIDANVASVGGVEVLRPSMIESEIDGKVPYKVSDETSYRADDG